MKIAIANSVGLDCDGYTIIHSPSRWSWGQKNNAHAFTYYPWELCYTSSLLKKETDFNVRFFDGCLHKMNLQSYIETLSFFKPDLLVMDPSARTIAVDRELMLAMKRCFGTRLAVGGSYAAAFPEEVSSWADYVMLGEYEFTVLAISRGEKNIPGLYPGVPHPLIDINLLPLPEDDDVSRLDYAIPPEPNCEYIEIQAYASRGCPFHCNFCVCGNLSYEKPNWRSRDIDKIIYEIKHLKQKYPIMEGIFFDEEMHNMKKSFILDLSDSIIKNGLDNLKYNAMCAYFCMDGDMLEAMKRAGYYKVRIGIETASRDVALLADMKQKYNRTTLENVLKTAYEIGISVYGTFTVGLRGADYEKDIETGEMLKSYVKSGWIKDVQVSINTPQPGTPFYKWADENGFILTKDWNKYDGGARAVVDRPNYRHFMVEKAFKNVLACYDEGLYLRNHHQLESSIISSLKFLRLDMKKVLIFRSNRMWQIKILILALKKYREDLIIDIIAQPEVIDELKNNGSINKVFNYDAGFFNEKNFFGLFSEEELKNVYDEIFVPINNKTSAGYESIYNISERISDKILTMFPDGKIEIYKK